MRPDHGTSTGFAHWGTTTLPDQQDVDVREPLTEGGLA